MPGLECNGLRETMRKARAPTTKSSVSIIFHPHFNDLVQTFQEEVAALLQVDPASFYIMLAGTNISTESSFRCMREYAPRVEDRGVDLVFKTRGGAKTLTVLKGNRDSKTKAMADTIKAMAGKMSKISQENKMIDKIRLKVQGALKTFKSMGGNYIMNAIAAQSPDKIHTMMQSFKSHDQYNKAMAIMKMVWEVEMTALEEIKNNIQIAQETMETGFFYILLHEWHTEAGLFNAAG